MKCTQCGKELASTAKFCTNCGASVEQGANEGMKENVNTYVQETGSEKKWKDAYTILLLVVVMLLAALIGLFIKNNINSNQISHNKNYRENYKRQEKNKDEKYEDEDYEVYAEDEEENEATNTPDKPEESIQQEAEQNVNVSQDFILPDSSTRYLTKSDLYGLTSEQCRLARNEIYARHGRMFSDEGLQRYFESFSWYTPSIAPEDFQEAVLNDYEVANRDLIVEYEKEQGYR